MSYALVLAAVVIAGMLCIPLVLLRSGKSPGGASELHQLLSALLHERGAPPWGPGLTPRHDAGRLPAMSPGVPVRPAPPAKKTANSEGDDLIQNILAHNLSLRDDDASEGALG
jgi:hypothetical protein